MGFYQVDMFKKPKPIYLRCPFCGSKDMLQVRQVEWMSTLGMEKAFSMHCLSCHMVFGEHYGEPVFKSEGDLIAAWNVRKY